ncbi:sensor histidine kinase [Evansella sp. AB-P1]|uniref:sensor histidine kinase n=1 Tax=Evansella sp. AB-P1 TaxID=3037653 RepID=UPI00241D4B1D|nr:sensor histidine kinase [Evansella sp. AB-P1]MDG5788054.1 sensor histidine kinase [Evansella sp. AB-P1]
MGSFWIWLIVLVISWNLAITHYSLPINEMPERILGTAFFFALFFLCPLFRKNKGVLTVLLSVVSILAIVVLWPEKEGELNYYILFVFSILAGKAIYRLRSIQGAIVGGILFVGALVPHFFGYAVFPPLFTVIYAVLLGTAFVIYRNTLQLEEEVSARNEAFLSEYRLMKRRLATSEQLARQEERGQIARDIHDSVGHKLTALLMQLEVFRMETDNDKKERVNDLKMLAKESLEETRKAVKALKEDDAGGLSAIISLIRKLEVESFIRVHFTVKHGALSAPLGNDQAVVVYRSVQEALTNMMKHGKRKEVDILFEAPGGTAFRFEVTNETNEDQSTYREGFGLSSMKERVEQVGGVLEVNQYGGKFIVRGTLPLVMEGGRGNDSNIVSRGSGDGSSRLENDDRNGSRAEGYR